MVIAHVIDSMEVGGAEAVVAALCRLQAAAGHTVSVHCLHQKGAVAEQLEHEGTAVLVHGPAASGVILWRLYRAFRETRPGVVHCHNKSATVHAAAVARLAGARVLVSTRHGMAALPYRLRCCVRCGPAQHDCRRHVCCAQGRHDSKRRLPVDGSNGKSC